MAWFDDLNLPGATITGHFGFVRADGPDEDDRPDLTLASGAVTLTPTASSVRAGGAWVGISPVTARIFEGELVTGEEDPRPVRILSTDADTGVEGWGWTARFDIAGASIKPVTFRAPTEGVHLTGDSLIPITGQPVEVLEGAAGESAYEIMVRRGDWEGTEDEWIDFYFNRETGTEGSTSWSDITGKPTTYPPTAHDHTIAEVTGLGTALDGKQPIGDYATEAYVGAAIDAIPGPDLSGLVSSGTVTSIWTGTEAQYAAVSPKDPATLYLIT